jgi:hypothetical protein
MECPVCYENSVNCTLVCGHKFCKSCVKTWYLKGNESGCPMCRRKVHYRRMPIKKWRAEADEAKKETVFEECFDEILEAVMEPMVFEIKREHVENWKLTVPEHRFTPVVNGNVVTLHRKNVNTAELGDLQRTFRAIRDEASADEIEYVLVDSYDYYSDRRVHLNNRTYSEIGHWYPHQKHRGDPMRNKKSYLRK